jgi:methylmalonyl-CoA/ethylmalonyl-CoA epimerase
MDAGPLTRCRRLLMISRIDHVSIAVKDFNRARAFFETVFGALPGQGAKDDHLKYFWQIFSLGDLSRLELMEATGEGSFLNNFLASKQIGGVHHITLETPDIQHMMRHLEKNDIPFFGFSELGDAWKELFIHPRDAFGILIQIAQMSEPDDYLGESVKHGHGKRWSVEKAGPEFILTLAHPGGGKVRLTLSREEIQAFINDLENVI